MRIQFIQDIIDFFRNKSLYAKVFVDKEKEILEIKNYETLILGSSHIANFKTQDGELNVALPSQDLYNSYMMYEKYNHKDLKNVVISFSVFTPGHCLIKTNDYQQSVLYKIIFGFDYEYEDIAREKKLYIMEKTQTRILKHLKSNLKKENSVSSDNYQNKEYIKQRALKHLKNNKRTPDEMRWFIKFLQKAQDNNQNVIVVVPPFTNVYKSVLPAYEELFFKLNDAIKSFKNCRIINFYNIQLQEESFVDGDHITSETWESLASEIRDCYI